MRISKLVALAIPTIMMSGAYSSSASAQLVELAINDDEAWEHSLTDLALPPEIAGYDREHVKAAGQGELDVIGGYLGGDGTILTVFAYRPGLANVSIWTDRALKAIKASPMTSKADLAEMKTTFFSPSKGRAGKSAVRTVMPVSGGMKSTGLIIAPYGEWFIKIRLSSPTMSVEELEAKLIKAYGELNVGDGAYEHGEAYTIVPCEKDLPRKKAKRSKANRDDDMMQAIVGQAFMGIAAEKRSEEGAEIGPQPTYCSDSKGEELWTAYKPLDDNTQYVVALGDAGVAASVGKSGILELLGKGKGSHEVTLLGKADTASYRPFRSMPSPKQAVDVIFKERPTSSTTRQTGADGDTKTTINLPSSD